VVGGLEGVRDHASVADAERRGGDAAELGDQHRAAEARLRVELGEPLEGLGVLVGGVADAVRGDHAAQQISTR